LGSISPGSGGYILKDINGTLVANVVFYYVPTLKIMVIKVNQGAIRRPLEGAEALLRSI
jgi:hypothetical protein